MLQNSGVALVHCHITSLLFLEDSTAEISDIQ